MMPKSEYKGMTQFCLDAERWSAVAGSIYTVPEGKNQIHSYRSVIPRNTSHSVLKLTVCWIKFQGGKKICLTA